MAYTLFIDSQTLKQHTIINGSADPDKFMQFIRIAQDIHIQNYLGQQLFERLQAGIVADDLTADETTLIDDYVQVCLIHFAAAEWMTFSRFDIAQGGAFAHQQDNATVMSTDEINSLAAKEKGYAEYYATRLVNFLCENSSTYPLYSANTGAEITPDRKVNYSGSWYMGGSGKSNDWKTSE